MFEVVGQPLGRALDLQDLDRLGCVRVGVSGGDLVLVDRLPELAHGVLVERGQGRLLGLIVYEQEAPVLLVAAGGSADGGIEDALLDLLGDGLGADPAHGARRIQGLVEFHTA